MGSEWAMIVTMPDGSEWAYSVMEIARNRAAHYADEFGGDVERSLREDTLPLFRSDPYEIEDWAENNMNEDMLEMRVRVKDPPKPDMQFGWVNGSKRIDAQEPHP